MMILDYRGRRDVVYDGNLDLIGGPGLDLALLNDLLLLYDGKSSR